jgi:hypothetical protein
MGFHEQALAAKTGTEDAQRPQPVLVDGMPLVLCVQCNRYREAYPALDGALWRFAFLFGLGEPGTAS